MWNYSYLCSTVLCEDVVTRRAGLARGVTHADIHTHLLRNILSELLMWNASYVQKTLQ